MPGDPRVGRPRVTASAGTAAQRLAVLLFVGALVEAGPPERIAGAEPILVIEDPEAHLHPLTLTALWRVIERLRGQRVVTTHSEALLALTPLADLRRLTRSSGTVRSWQVPVGALDPDAARRFAYHVRQRRGLATFARCWLLIEGETEAWALPELARLAGYDLAAEGVVPVEFAQAGLEPLLIVADALGIAWHLLTDGDVAGARYAAFVRDRAAASGRRASLTRLDERDLEHTLFVHGFADVYLAHAGSGGRRLPAGAVIARAIERSSKPALALAVLDAAAGRGPDGVPPQLREAVEASIALARAAGLARAMPAPAPRPERGARGWRPPS
jgi:putative ATP-dependent endonuclease of OLD family